MGWLSNKVTGWATKTQARELEEFISRLRMMDADEIGMLVAFATDRRHKLRELYGWDMLYRSPPVKAALRAEGEGRKS